MQYLTNTTVALCGTFPQDITSFLPSTRIVTWSPHITALLVGTHYDTKWKYTVAIARGIRIVHLYDVFPPSDLLVDRYRPTALTSIIGHGSAIEDLRCWLTSWTPATTPHAALVSGPPGIGKTTLVHLLAAACDYELIELNASNERSASAVKKIFDEAAGCRYVGKRRLIVMDEVDGMSSGDRGGIGELARLIRAGPTFPIICITNERSTPRMRPLASCTLDIRCARPAKHIIAKALMHIVKKEKLEHCITEKQLETLCEQNGNDIRSLLNSLQFQSVSRKDELLRIDPFSATGRLFGGGGTIDDLCNLVFIDHSLVPLMVAEGYVGAAARKNNSMAVTLAADRLGLYDIIDQRIHRSHAWGLLPAAVTMIVGVAVAADGAAPFNIFPSWLGKYSKRQKHRRWHNSMAQRMGMSSMAVLESRSLLRLRLFNNGTANQIVDRLVDYGLTRDDMMETLVETVYTGDEESIKIDSKLKASISRMWKKRVTCDEDTLIVENDDGYDSNDSTVTYDED